MNRIPRRLLAALLTAVLASAYAPAQQVTVPRVTLTPSLGGALGVPGLLPGTPAGPASFGLSSSLSLTPALSVIPAPAIITPGVAAVAAPIALAPVASAPSIAGKTVANAETPAQKIAPALETLELSAASRHGRGRDEQNGGKFFDGSKQRAHIVAAVPEAATGPKGFIKNADGVWVGGRVAEQALWINKMHAELSPTLDLDDVMDVMDDAYDESRVKLRSAEKAAADRKLAASSVHLEGTRNWVDAILEDADGENIAVHTHRVYFHPAPGNPASEIAEGIRRASKYIDHAMEDFAAGGLAEKDLKVTFKQVQLNFDTRGYKEIEDALRAKEAELRAKFGDRFVFNYITEGKLESKALRAEYNRLVEVFQEQPDGLMGILDGVTYSREVGVGHELNSHKKRIAMGLKITQAGRDFFDEKGYVTEFDAITEPVADAAKPLSERDVVLWEDKSARVWMPLEKVLEDTFLYKLRIYRANRALIEKSLGGAPLKVKFSVDVGGAHRRAAAQGFLVWKDPRQQELMEYLQANEAAMSKEYGFPVSFIFVNSHPGENPDLFLQEPISEQDWIAMQKTEKGGKGKKRGDRKHGRR